MPEAYVHRSVAVSALELSKISLPGTIAPYYMGANGPDVMFTYRVLSRRKLYDLEALGTRMHDEKCGHFLRTLIFSAHTPAQMSYVLGFVTHYAADSVMHPYVEFECRESGQFHVPHGHGFCEVSLDSMLHEKECGTPAVRAADAAAKLNPQELAEVVQLLRDAISHVYEEEVPTEAIADTFNSFYDLHAAFCSRFGILRGIIWCVERLILHNPGFGLCHVTPAKQPEGGFVSNWVNPFTNEVMTQGPEELYCRSKELAAVYLKTVQGYWLGKISKQALAADIGDRSYSTGLQSEGA